MMMLNDDSAPSHDLPASQKPTEHRSWTGYALLLVGFVALVSALHTSWYPVFVDTYYHMGVIQGMEQAGGLPTWAFWELAPAGRVHIYPPSLHIVGYLATFLGVSPEAFITFSSWLLYPAFLLTVWLWVRGVFGARAALVTVILLCGPSAVIWNQTSFNANALAMTLAPLALLALEKERFLACGVLSFLATTAHPMGLFLPPALAINALLRRKRLLAGLLAASIPVLLYGPWLAHVWAYRDFLPEERTGGDVSIGGIGAGSMLDLGVAMGIAALVGLGWIVARRREALSLLGPLVGFAVVFPMGFGGRFFQFNSQWPLAAIGGFGMGMLLDRLDRGAPWRRSTVKVVSVGLAFLVLATWASVGIRLPRSFDGRRDRGARPARVDRPGPGAPEPTPPDAEPPGWWSSFSLGASALAQLLDPDSQPAPFGGGGGPGPGGNRPQGRAAGDRRAAGARGPGRAGPAGMGMIHQEGARELFEATVRLVAPGEVIFLENPMAASLLTGVTGRWTSSGILRDVTSAEGRADPQECAFLATVGGGFPGGGPGGPPAGMRGGFPGGGRGGFRPGLPGMDRRSEAAGPEGFEKVFENSFGSLFRNLTPPPRIEPREATVPAVGIFVLAGLGLLVSALDLLLSRERRGARLLLAVVAVVGAGIVLAPLAWTAATEILHPPEAPERAADQPFDAPPPGVGPGPGAPPRDAAVPERLRARYGRIQEAIPESLRMGEDPRAFWAPEDEMRFRELLDDGNLTEAEAILEEALRRLDLMSGRPGP